MFSKFHFILLFVFIRMYKSNIYCGRDTDTLNILIKVSVTGDSAAIRQKREGEDINIKFCALEFPNIKMI